MAGHRVRRVALWVVTGMSGAALFMALCPWSPWAPASVESHEENWPGWGFTHTQFSADGGDPGSVGSAQNALRTVPMVQAQHIMGFGADNPEPSPGHYEFDSLDRRMNLIRGTGGTPVIILCCAPDWMKGGEPGQTDWNKLEDAPLPEHFADFAALSALIAQRYSYVRHFVVWNEFKGFFDDDEKRWKADEYTTLYNAVRDAVKAVNPANRVGGPYLDFSRPFDHSYASPGLRGPWGSVDQRVLDAFMYWKNHRTGADFVVVDSHAVTDTGGGDPFAALTRFSAVDRWLRIHDDLPVWWAEWYVEPTGPDWPPGRDVALRIAAMIELASTGAQTVLYWNPRPQGQTCAECLWTDTWMANGGKPLPFLTDVLQRFASTFPPDVRRWKVAAPEGVLALASESTLLVVNTTESAIRAEVSGRSIDLPGYGFRWSTPRH
ncbi:xylan 1,4-beta-xylosidase [Mycobacterium sp. MS1601]|nr:xylan 1,4-beta-xylosidase [Mycobacterium sp. MS1601]